MSDADNNPSDADSDIEDIEVRARLLKAAITLTGEEVAEILRILGMSQTRLARELGVHPNTVHRWTGDWLLVPQYTVAYLTTLLQLREARERVAVLEGRRQEIEA